MCVKEYLCCIYSYNEKCEAAYFQIINLKRYKRASQLRLYHLYNTLIVSTYKFIDQLQHMCFALRTVGDNQFAQWYVLYSVPELLNFRSLRTLLVEYHSAC